MYHGCVGGAPGTKPNQAMQRIVGPCKGACCMRGNVMGHEAAMHVPRNIYAIRQSLPTW